MWHLVKCSQKTTIRIVYLVLIQKSFLRCHITSMTILMLVLEKRYAEAIFNIRVIITILFHGVIIHICAR